MIRSESIVELTKALLKAQSAFPALIRDATNPHFRSKYADLDSVIDATRKPLADNGLTIIQTTDVRDGGLTVLLTTLAHISGQYIGSVYPLVPVKQDPPSLGAAMTYGRRYQHMAIVNLAPEDDDGNLAAGRPEMAAPAQRPARDFATPTNPHPPSGEIEDGLRVTDTKVVKGKSKSSGKPFTKYNVMLSDGRTASTFDEGLYEKAKLAMARGLTVEVSTTQSPYGVDLLHLEPTIHTDTGQGGDEPPPIDDEDIPF